MPYSAAGTEFDIAMRPYSTHSFVTMRMYSENMQTPYAACRRRRRCRCCAASHICIRAFRERLVRKSLRRSTRETFSIGNERATRDGDSTQRNSLITYMHICIYIQIYVSCVFLLN